MELNEHNTQILNKIKNNLLVTSSTYYPSSTVQVTEYNKFYPKFQGYPPKEIRIKYLTNNKHNLLKSEQYKTNINNTLSQKRLLTPIQSLSKLLQLISNLPNECIIKDFKYYSLKYKTLLV